MRILYATDGSAPAREGERLIASLFDRSEMHIHTFAVAPLLTFELDLPDASYELARLDVPVLNADQVALEAAEHLFKEGFSVSSSTSSGDPAREILRKIEADGYEMAVLGASHTTWMGTLLLGSISTHVLHHAPSSVLITHRAPTGSGNVLVGIDGSVGSRVALQTATKLLDSSRCRLTVATTVRQPWLSVAAYPPGPSFGGYTQYGALEKLAVDEAWKIVGRDCAELQGMGFEAEGRVLLGRAGPQLLKEAGSIGADLVAVGSRGLGPIRRGLLGSVSDQIVRHAPATLVGRGRSRGQIEVQQTA